MASNVIAIPATTLTGPGGATPAVYYVPTQLAPGQLQGGNNPLLLSLGGTWQGLTGVFEGSWDTTLAAPLPGQSVGVPNFTNPFPIRAFGAVDGKIVSSANPIVIPDNIQGGNGIAWYVIPDGGMMVRFRVVSLGGLGTQAGPVAQARTCDFFGPLLPAASVLPAQLFGPGIGAVPSGVPVQGSELFNGLTYDPLREDFTLPLGSGLSSDREAFRQREIMIVLLARMLVLMDKEWNREEADERSSISNYEDALALVGN